MSRIHSRLLSGLRAVLIATAVPATVAACCPKATVAPQPEQPVEIPAEPEAPVAPPVDAPPLAPPEVEADVPAPPVVDEAALRAADEAIPETGVRHTLSPFTKTLTVAPGDIITHSYVSHGSVGKSATASVGNKRVIMLVRTDLIYKHPEKMEKGMSGADAATGTFVFKALRPGKGEIRIRHMFRGEVTETIEVEVLVQ